MTATDVFLTHDWGTDEKGRNNHGRVTEVNVALKAAGLTTWFDEDKMTGNVVDQMCGGIDRATVVIVFITQRYCDKVGGSAQGDNCKMEFSYACRRRGISNMVAVVMEPRMLNPGNWSGGLGMALGGTLYVNMSEDIRGNMSSLISEIQGRIEGRDYSDPAPKAPLVVTPDPLSILRSGVHTVRFIKAEGVGSGYALAAHNDKRNDISWWTLAHKHRPGDQDEYWNVIPWNEGGKSCFKLEKARNRRSGFMLTAHNDKEGTHIRVLVHKANHNVGDECWDFEPKGANSFAIVKCCNRNVGMKLVCGESRNDESFWVNVDYQNTDHLWKIEISQ